MQAEAYLQRISALEAQIERDKQGTADLQATSADLSAAQQRIQVLEASAAAAEGRAVAAESRAQQAGAALEGKTTELRALELAMGELTYEAESGRGAELQSRQLQARPDQLHRA